MEKKRKNYVIIFALLVLFLSVAYATFVPPLADKIPLWAPSSNPSPKGNIGFVDAERVSITGKAKEMQELKYTLTKGWFSVSLVNAGDSITYDFFIKNMGAVAAKVTSIHVVSTKNNDAVLFDTSGLNVDDELSPGEVSTLRVKCSYNGKGIGNPLEKNEFYVVVNYAQK